MCKNYALGVMISNFSQYRSVFDIMLRSTVEYLLNILI